MASLTESRKAVHERFTALLEAPDRNSLTPAMHLSTSLRSLNGGQLSLLDRLLRLYAEHPQTSDEYRLVALLTTEVAKHV